MPARKETDTMKAYKKVAKATIATLEKRRDSQAEVETAGTAVSTFAWVSIDQALAAERRSSVWLWIFTFLGLLLLTLLLVVVGYFIPTHYLWTLKARILKYLVQLLPESGICLLTPATPPVIATAVDAWPRGP